MNDIFISYAREDREKAKAIAALFEAQGWSVWWDRSIPPGRSFDQVIEEALSAAKCVVVLWSRSSAASDWVKTEAAEGLARKILVPVRTRGTQSSARVSAAADGRSFALEGRLRRSGTAKEFLHAVAALLKSEVRPAPASIHRKMRIEAGDHRAGCSRGAGSRLVDLQIQWHPKQRPPFTHAFGRARQRVRFAESRHGEQGPLVPDLMRTPELGLEFWQRNQECPMFIHGRGNVENQGRTQTRTVRDSLSALHRSRANLRVVGRFHF